MRGPVLPLLAIDVLSALEAAASLIADLQVVVSNERARHTWYADPDTATIYLDGTYPPNATSAALLQALGALCRHHDLPIPIRGHHLTLLPEMPDQRVRSS